MGNLWEILQRKSSLKSVSIENVFAKKSPPKSLRQKVFAKKSSPKGLRQKVSAKVFAKKSPPKSLRQKVFTKVMGAPKKCYFLLISCTFFWSIRYFLLKCQ